MSDDDKYQSVQEHQARALVAALSLVAAADGKIEKREVDWMSRAIRAALETDPDPKILARVAAAAGRDADRAHDDLRFAAKDLNLTEKSAVLYAAALMMYADGGADDQERDTLANIAGALGLERSQGDMVAKKARGAASKLFS